MSKKGLFANTITDRKLGTVVNSIDITIATLGEVIRYLEDDEHKVDAETQIGITLATLGAVRRMLVESEERDDNNDKKRT